MQEMYTGFSKNVSLLEMAAKPGASGIPLTF